MGWAIPPYDVCIQSVKEEASVQRWTPTALHYTSLTVTYLVLSIHISPRLEQQFNTLDILLPHREYQSSLAVLYITITISHHITTP